jgi:protease-4
MYKKHIFGNNLAKRLALVVALSLAVAVLASACSDTGPTTENNAPPDKDFLARVSVVGEIGNMGDQYSSSDDSYHHDWTMKIIDDLIKNDNNKGLLLYVDSPGGSVYESDELYLRLAEYKEKTKRPIYVYMGPMAASGGYYISMAANRIYANRNCWTGSIGVISGTYFDVSGFLKKHGITATDITSGKNKNMGGYFEPMTDEQRAIMQSMVDEAYEQFAGIVAAGRGMELDKVKALADGRIYTARQAMDNGLIDAVAAEDDALTEIKKEMGDENIYVSDIRFVPASDWLGLSGTDPFSLLGLGHAGGQGGSDNGGADGSDIQSAASAGDIARVLDLATSGGRVPLKYMYGG